MGMSRKRVVLGSVVGGMLAGRIRELASAGDLGMMFENVERVQVIGGLTLRPTGSPSTTPPPSPRPAEFPTPLPSIKAVITNPPSTNKVIHPLKL